VEILIADDIEASRILLKRTLERAGYSVVTASNGAEALIKARKSSPDIIVSDILMPEMDGFRFCREVKQDELLCDIPFIFYSATYTDQKDEILAVALGASRFIRKPVENEEFLKIIQEVIIEYKEKRMLVSATAPQDDAMVMKMYEERMESKLYDKIKALDRERNALLKMETELRFSEEKYRSIFDNVNDAIFIHAVEDARILDVNQKMCDMFGYDREEALHLKVEDLSSADPAVTLETARTYIEKTIHEGPQIFQWQCKDKYGNLFWVEVNLKLIKRDTQDRIVAVVRDISAQKRAEASLMESEQTLKAIFDSAIDGILVADVKNKKFLTGNKAIREMLGYSIEEIQALGVLDIHPEKDLPNVLEQFEKQARKEIITTKNLPIKRKDGSIFYADINSSPVVIGDKNYLVGIFRDNTAYKETEDALTESEERFRAIFENSPVGISIANADGRLVDSNPAFQKMLGYTKDELLTKFSDFTYPDDVPKNIHLFQEMVEGKRDHYRMEKRYYHKNGSIVWANLIVTAIRDRGGTFKYNFAIIENITERKALEDQLRHAQKLEAIGQLAGGVAHDFNNILTAIIGYGSILKMKLKDNEQMLHNINQILAITERGAGLTQSLLAFSRKQAISLKPIKLNDLVERIGKLIPRLIGEEIEFRIILSEEDMTVMADSGQIEQVLMNLASNARDAMPNGGVLTIQTEHAGLDEDYVKIHGFGAKGPYAIISVSDKGAGIDAELIDKIFEPFFTTKVVGEGTGLGLSLVYGIIKQHSGYINVYSEPGQGTSFKIYLPLIKEVIVEPKRTESPAETGGTETILLAEDEESVRGAITGILKEYGFTVIEAVDGKDAIAKYTENKDRIDLLILDVGMPNMNGKEAHDEIKKINPGIKAIFTSGYTAKTIHVKGVLNEEIHFLAKPVLPQNLLRKIREVLNES